MLEEPATKGEAMELIRSLVEAIILIPEKRELRIELCGELAGILQLCAGNKKPTVWEDSGFSKQVKLVAGARLVDPST
ncbi:hypothetical protein [Telmatospirillum sp. J64-1]|uniref:hypothetical protein n=1 Tax=Telmatospirillum sp. J64-1 TaxID=2502183 RepID=UPI00115E4D00